MCNASKCDAFQRAALFRCFLFFFGSFLIIITVDLHWNHWDSLILQVGLQFRKRLLGFQCFVMTMHQLFFQFPKLGFTFCQFSPSEPKTYYNARYNCNKQDNRVNDIIKCKCN